MKIVQQVLTKDGWLIWKWALANLLIFLLVYRSYYLPVYVYLCFFLNFYRPTYLLSTCTNIPFLLSLYKSIYLHFLCFLSIIICLSSYLFNLSNLSNPFNLSTLSNLSILYPSIDRSILCILSILSIYRKIFSIDLSISLFYFVLCYSILSILVYSILF